MLWRAWMKYAHSYLRIIHTYLHIKIIYTVCLCIRTYIHISYTCWCNRDQNMFWRNCVLSIRRRRKIRDEWSITFANSISSQIRGNTPRGFELRKIQRDIITDRVSYMNKVECFVHSSYDRLLQCVKVQFFRTFGAWVRHNWRKCFHHTLKLEIFLVRDFILHFCFHFPFEFHV